MDTFKVLSRILGFDCVLYRHASPSDLDDLRRDLETGPRIDALFTEFPGNPLLGSMDLERIHHLSAEYGFVVVVDDTVGTSVNVNLLKHCDVICTSLTKMFSGKCNVMGGSVVFNPLSEHYDNLINEISKLHVNTYFSLDLLVMEKNSIDFHRRVTLASRNAERIADQLRSHESVSRVFYPRGNDTQQYYEKYRREGGGYGYLLSVCFVSPAAAIAFHDALDVAKGPSLGTDFTLACAYTLLAHYSELEWAARSGVVEHLVRISVGLEDASYLERVVGVALTAAEGYMS